MTRVLSGWTERIRHNQVKDVQSEALALRRRVIRIAGGVPEMAKDETMKRVVDGLSIAISACQRECDEYEEETGREGKE